MVYKRYIKRNGKKFGPYYYESYRDEDGNSRTRQVSAPKLNIKKLFLFSFLIISLLAVILFFTYTGFSNPKLTIESILSQTHSGVVEQSKEKPALVEENSENVVVKTAKNVYSFLTGLVVEEISEENSEKTEIIEELEVVEISNETLEEEFEEEVNDTIESPLGDDSSRDEPGGPSGEPNQTEVEQIVNGSLEDGLNSSEEIANESFVEIGINSSEKVEKETKKNKSEENKIFSIVEEPVTNETVVEDNSTIIAISDIVANISTNQFSAIIGKPVRWKKNVKLDLVEGGSVINLTVRLPNLAGNISVKKIDTVTKEEEELKITSTNQKIVEEVEPVVAITGGFIANSFRSFMKVSGKVVEVIESDEEVVVEIDEVLEDNDELVIEYYTDAPYSEEKILNEDKKEIKIVGPEEVHYENVLAFSELPYLISNKNNVKIYWVLNDSRQEVEFEIYDLDEDGFYDSVGWIVPHLSEQIYELEINVLNVQSYPAVGGNWEVKFSTIGKANLTIKAIETTTWSNENENMDLKFLSLYCGSNVLNYEWINESVFLENYECNETGTETSKVLTEGIHVLEFDFGGQKANAYNDASDTSMPKTFSLNGKLTNSSGDALSGTYNMTFKIYNVSTGGTALWQENQTVSVDSNGIYHATLTNITDSFSGITYLGIAVANDSEMTPRINLTSTPYSHRAILAEDLDSTKNYDIQNLSLAQKITFGLGEIIDNLIDDWVTVTGNLNVTGNVSADYFIGDGSLLAGIATSDGSINSSSWNSTGDKVFLSNTSAFVGIGTTTPSSKLEVNGTGGLFHVKNDSDSFLFVNETSGNVGIGTSSPNSKLEINGSGVLLNIKNDSNSFLFVNSTSGNVGIGTTDASNILDVAGVAETEKMLIVDPSQTANLIGGSPIAALHIRTITGGAGIHTAWTPMDITYPYGENLQFGEWNGTTFTERMRISGEVEGIEGNVGINITLPQQTLNVGGDGNITGYLIVGGNITADYYFGDGSQLTGIVSSGQNSSSWNRSGTNVILANSGDFVGIGTTNPNQSLVIFSDTSSGNFLEFYNSRNIAAIGDIIGGINFYNTDISGGGPGVRNAIKSVSQDAIGAKFDIVFQFDGDNKFRFTDTGYFGLGTDSPSTFLDVYSETATGPIGMFRNLDTSPNDQGKVLYLQGGSDSVSSYILSAFTRAGINVFDIRGNGYVSIGASGNSTSERLQVADNIWLQNDSGKLIFGQTKNVSILTDGNFFNITNEVESIPFNFKGFSEYNFDNDVEIDGDLDVTGNYSIQGNLGYSGTCINTTYLGGIAISCND